MSLRRAASAAGALSAGPSVVSTAAGPDAPAADEGLFDRQTDPKPLFRLSRASETILTALRPDGPPARKVWDAEGALSQSASNLFRLRAVKLPELKDLPPGRSTAYGQNPLFEDARTQLRPGTASRAASQPAPADPAAPHRRPSSSSSKKAAKAEAASETRQKRSKKYFDLLMGAHEARTAKWAAEDEAAACAKAEEAALWATRTTISAERRAIAEQRAQAERLARRAAGETSSRSESSRSSTSGDSAETREPSEEFGPPPDDLAPLVAFDGMMEVDIEFVVPRRPGEPESPEPELESASSRREDSKGSKSDGSSSTSLGNDEDLAALMQEGLLGEDEQGLGDLYEELEELKEEVGGDEASAKSEASDDVPDALRLKGKKNIWDNPMPRWCLGIGGTTFFVPDAERYAFGAALPPPPPPSLLGRRRVRLKPRLPLEISNHRYRDEHPNIWPEEPFSPGKQDYVRFEQKLLTLDFYKGCSKAMARLPQAERTSDLAPHRKDFGKMVASETKRSQAWKNFNHREELKRKQAAIKARELAEVQEKAAREARLAANMEAAGIHEG